jgi:hypothetical protein
MLVRSIVGDILAQLIEKHELHFFLLILMSVSLGVLPVFISLLSSQLKKAVYLKSLIRINQLPFYVDRWQHEPRKCFATFIL